ncbi:Cysteine synthase [Halorhabdus sp. SVX81]|uniref:PLP-dependent cysteine synthase family protein n=1 Tax=Halorhabdus sp. SVX81 TaxID=2978283 RepID=UPI0023DC5A70|nr:cysteine synthase family protein [Halorhabdus sp. SVX81]WEL16673.1 Cysteine synthase [Halorhabdus sp. SVX81]
MGRNDNPNTSDVTDVTFKADDPILKQIGDTPLVEFPGNEAIFCKLEAKNPTRSHKDRLGLGMILTMRKRGELEPGQRVIEASSGNMAGGVALAANRLGHPYTIVAPESASPIKMGYVRALGGELIQTPAVPHDHEDYYQKKATEHAKETGGVLINQYERSLNPEVHYAWTGPELWEQIEGLGITHIVAATGSGGTLSGIGRYVKENDPSVTIVGVDAEQSNISRDFTGQERGEYDTEVEGLGQYRTTDAIDFEVIDEVMDIPDNVALETTRRVAEKDGMLVGVSSGAVLAAAQDILKSDPDARIVTIVHDGAEQYFHQVEGW